MSHFTCLVIGDDPESQLDPFIEGENGGNWDWYVIGGRWSGYFKLKEGVRGTLGEPGVGDNKPTYDANSARKKDIDFKFMREKAAQNAEKRYDRAVRLFGGSIPLIEFPWKEVSKDDSIENWDKKREKYHDQIALRKLSDLRKSKDLSKEDSEFLRDFYFDLEDYQYTLEEYVQCARDNAISTWAVIHNGKWIEKGSMGWFGTSSNNRDQNEWNHVFNDIIDNLPDDTLLTLVDCHI